MTHYDCDPEVMADEPINKPGLKAGARAAMGTAGEDAPGRILHTHDGRAWFQPEDARYPSFLVNISNLKPLSGLSPKERLIQRLADALTVTGPRDFGTTAKILAAFGFIERQYLKEIGEQGE